MNTGYSRGRCELMELQNERNRDFLRRLNGDREAHFERLAELLNGFVTDRFHEYQLLLQEELQKELKLLQEETKRRMSAFHGIRELEEDILSRGLEGFVNGKMVEAVGVFEEKKLLCAETVYGLIPDSYVEYRPAWETFENVEFSMDEAFIPGLPWRQELEDIREAKAQMKEEISRTELERQEAEAGFQELMHQNAAKRSELEKEKPEIKYITKVIRREGFFGFVKDLFGKPRTETITDDRELKEWQKQVETIQEGYDAQAREWNEKLEAIKKRKEEKESEYGRLVREQREAEDRIRTMLEEKVQEELEHCLYGEGGLSDRMKAALEHDMRQSAEEVGGLAGKACRDWSLG